MGFSKRWKQKMYEERKHYLDSVKIASGCKDCGIWGPAEILSFDHVVGEKLFSIGSQWDVGFIRVKEEIEKCEVVCLNCHQKRTVIKLKEKEIGAPPFIPFRKIPRLSRPCIITEKIDGTNGVVWVDEDRDVWAGSRNGWITAKEDNYGFAEWVEKNEDSFRNYGAGVYRGEWWGQGIQRGYGLKEKRFSLINAKRWVDESTRPTCCHVVPVLYEGLFTTEAAECALKELAIHGSHAAPGFMRPEGIIIYHVSGNLMFKKTIEKDIVGKRILSVTEDDFFGLIFEVE